jgi:hypothetical protein
MKVVNYLIYFGLFFVYHSSPAQVHTFVGELQLGYKKYLPAGYDNKIPHRLFIDHWIIKIFLQKGNGEKGDEVKEVRLLPKEDWYSKYNEEIKKVDLVIDLPDNLLPQVNGKAVEQGNINLVAEIWSKNPNKFYAKIEDPINISWWKHNGNNNKDYYYVNSSTFKLNKPISIGSPAEVGLSLALDFVNIAIDSTSDEIPQFKYVVKELDSLIKEKVDSVDLSYSQFSNYSKLLIFIEQYVSDGSFINAEAKELYADLQNLRDSLKTINNENKIGDDRRSSLLERVERSSIMLYQYQRTIDRLRKYYNYLQLILYTPRSKHKKFQIDNKGTLTFGFGNSLLYSTRRLYNVSLSRGDTVHFESVSRVNMALSGGLFWSPPMKQSIEHDTITRRPTLSLGLLVTYSIIPNSSQLPSSNPFGIAFALGVKRQNLGLRLTTNMKLTRQPRQYFIDQYKDKNLTFPSLDINDNRIFINKTDLGLGFSIIYLLK